jgi:hypothetical protein
MSGVLPKRSSEAAPCGASRAERAADEPYSELAAFTLPPRRRGTRTARAEMAAALLEPSPATEVLARGEDTCPLDNPDRHRGQSPFESATDAPATGLLQQTSDSSVTCWHSAAGGGIRHQRSSSHPAEIKPKELEIHWKADGGDHHRHTQPPTSSRPSAAMPCCICELLPRALWSSRNGTRTRRDLEREPASELWPPPTSPAAPSSPPTSRSSSREAKPTW